MFKIKISITVGSIKNLLDVLKSPSILRKPVRLIVIDYMKNVNIHTDFDFVANEDCLECFNINLEISDPPCKLTFNSRYMKIRTSVNNTLNCSYGYSL